MRVMFANEVYYKSFTEDDYELPEQRESSPERFEKFEFEDGKQNQNPNSSSPQVLDYYKSSNRKRNVIIQIEVDEDRKYEKPEVSPLGLLGMDGLNPSKYTSSKKSETEFICSKNFNYTNSEPVTPEHMPYSLKTRKEAPQSDKLSLKKESSATVRETTSLQTIESSVDPGSFKLVDYCVGQCYPKNQDHQSNPTRKSSSMER